MKSLARVFVVVMFAVLASSGQVTSAKDDIPESQYLTAVINGFETIEKSNYRMVRTEELVSITSKDAKLQERILLEVIRPGKSRTVREKFNGYPKREENISINGSFYVKREDDPWIIYSRGMSFGLGLGTGFERVRHRSIPKVDFGAAKADFFEIISERYYDKNVNGHEVAVKIVRTTRVWYSTDGKLLKKIEETFAEGSNDMDRETTTYEYDPQDLKIEAPIK